MKHIINISTVIILAFLVHSCARQSNPSGGLKDETPPVLEESRPEMGELGYDKQLIRIFFDEIIVLKDLTSNFLVSPPTLKTPEVKAYGDELFVEFEDSLQSNTVYTLYFGDAVVDNNEGNILPNFTFSFSTGYLIDTMRIQGYAVDAMTLDPAQGLLVGAYSNFDDSTFTKDIPLRIAKTNSEGWFTINNLTPGSYKVRAIDDMDNNFMFNQPGETIGFSDEIFETSQETIILMDSIFTDSIGDDDEHFIKFKELRERDTIVYYPDDIMLMTFIEDRNFQVLKEKNRETEWKLDFVFESKVLEEPKIHLYDDMMNEDWYIQEYSEDSLTVSYWVKDSSLYKLDTIPVILDYQVTDTLEQFVWQKDTIQMRFKRKQKSERQKKREEKKEKKADSPVKKVAALALANSAKSGVPYFGDITFTSPQPISSIRDTSIRLFEIINDSTMESVRYKFVQDDQLARQYHLEYEWDEDKEYQMIIDSATFYDIYGHTNDSIGQRIKIQAEDEFSTIIINLQNLKGDAVVQLLDGSQEVIDELAVKKDEVEAVFFYLKPNKYYVSLFYDTNGNGKWDTGDYSEKRQAEERRFLPKMIQAKAYYEMVEDWDVEALELLQQKPKDLAPKK